MNVSVKWSCQANNDPITAFPDRKAEPLTAETASSLALPRLLASQAASQPMRQVTLIATGPYIPRKKHSADSVQTESPCRSTSFQFVWCASSCRPQSLLPNPGLNTRFAECSLPRLSSADQSVTLCTVSSTTESYPSMGFDPLQGLPLDSLCSPSRSHNHIQSPLLISEHPGWLA